ESFPSPSGSGSSSPGRTYVPFSHLPRSTSAHLFEQKGWKSGDCGFPQIAHLRCALSGRCSDIESLAGELIARLEADARRATACQSGTHFVAMRLEPAYDFRRRAHNDLFARCGGGLALDAADDIHRYRIARALAAVTVARTAAFRHQLHQRIADALARDLNK